MDSLLIYASAGIIFLYAGYILVEHLYHLAKGCQGCGECGKKDR